MFKNIKPESILNVCTVELGLQGLARRETPVSNAQTLDYLMGRHTTFDPPPPISYVIIYYIPEGTRMAVEIKLKLDNPTNTITCDFFSISGEEHTRTTCLNSSQYLRIKVTRCYISCYT